MDTDLSISENSSENGFSPAGDHIRCLKVEVSAHGICELNGGRVSNVIPRDNIRQITLCSGTDVRYPFGQFAAGLAIFALGLLGLAADFLDAIAIARGYPVQPDPGVFFLPMNPLAFFLIAGIGFWVLSGVFRVRYFFMIETEKGERRVSFGKPADLNEIKRFIWKMKMRFGYAIDDISAFSPETELG